MACPFFILCTTATIWWAPDTISCISLFFCILSEISYIYLPRYFIFKFLELVLIILKTNQYVK